jgi:hypothetical protein
VLLEVKSFVVSARLASKDTFYLIHLKVQAKQGLKIRDKKITNKFLRVCVLEREQLHQ